MLGEFSVYAAEWKWDGIRGQLIRGNLKRFCGPAARAMENRWLEIESAATDLPDGTVLDGEFLHAC